MVPSPMNCVQQLILVGVGGQGILTLSRIIALAAVKKGYNIRIGETLGMAQRFGTVISYVRFGMEVYSPLPVGYVDTVIALELGESLRVWKYISPNTLVVVNKKLIPSILASLSFLPEYRNFALPSEEIILSELKKVSKRLIVVDGYRALEEQGLSPRSLNTYMLGIAVAKGGILLDPRDIEESINEILPQRAIEQAIKAFRLGLEQGQRFHIGAAK